MTTVIITKTITFDECPWLKEIPEMLNIEVELFTEYLKEGTLLITSVDDSYLSTGGYTLVSLTEESNVEFELPNSSLETIKSLHVLYQGTLCNVTDATMRIANLSDLNFDLLKDNKKIKDKAVSNRYNVIFFSFVLVIMYLLILGVINLVVVRNNMLPIWFMSTIDIALIIGYILPFAIFMSNSVLPFINYILINLAITSYATSTKSTTSS